MTWLLEHPPVRDQFRTTRREPESGVVVIHTAESTPDTVATDGGAEAVANFIRTRTTPGSYHVLADSDSRLQLLPWTCEAYQDGTGSNPHAVGLSVATRADWWPWAPKAWRDGAIEHLAQAAAEYALWLYEKRGIRIPAKRITRAESEARQPGFISHAERDPARRTDPGAGFPWDQFLGRFAELTDQAETPPPSPFEEDDMHLIRRVEDGTIALTGPGTFRPLNPEEAGVAAGVLGRGAMDVNARQYDVWRVLCLSSGDDDVEMIRGSLADLADVDLSDEQVRSIIDAIPGQVKQALREGTG